MSTAPVFAPDGTLGDIPVERVPDAIKAGFKPGVHMIASDGTKGVIPADKVAEATVKGGLKIEPFSDQPVQQPGFWHSLASDLVGMVKPSPGGGMSSPYPGVTSESGQIAWKNAQTAAKNEQDAGYSKPYMAAAGVAQGLGVNVPGMEQSAKEGDAAGVLGHAAAVPVAVAATAGLAKGAGAISEALPSTERAAANFKSVSASAGKHTVAVTPQLSDALMQYQQLVDTGGSRALAVSKLMNRLTRPEATPLTYDEARLFSSNISRLSADESMRLTPVMKRAIGQIAGELNGSIENTASAAGQLDKYQSAMKEYSQAKTNQARLEVLKKYGIKAGLAAVGGGAAVAGGKAMMDVINQ